MKVWLDDVREPPDRSWVWVKTSAEALRLVRNHAIDFISLDFDLGGDDTAYPVAALIEARAHRGKAPPGWRVHSANPVGAARLRAALMAAEAAWKNHLKAKSQNALSGPIE